MLLFSYRIQWTQQKAVKFLTKKVLSGKYGLACKDAEGTSVYSDNRGHLFSIYFLTRALAKDLNESLRSIFLTRIFSEQHENLWGYSPRGYFKDDGNNPYFVDADDTAFALHTLRMLGIFRNSEYFKPFFKEVSFNNVNYCLLTTFISNHGDKVSIVPSHLDNLNVHPEVNANVYALFIDTANESLISVSFIENIQLEDGSWPSYFYPNKYYSTMLFIELLLKKDLSAKSLEKGLKFLHQELATKSHKLDAYSLSLILIPLLKSKQFSKEVKTGIASLIHQQKNDGSWLCKDVIWEFHESPDKVWISRDSESVICTSLALEAISLFLNFKQEGLLSF
jgi:hypothetical protein